MKKLIWTSFALIMSTGLSWGQCAMCRGTVETNMSTGPDVFANGINFGVLYLLAMPYLAVLTVGYLWYRNSKKLQAQRLAVRQRVQEALRNEG